MANDKTTTVSRRDFLKTTALAGCGAVVASHFDFARDLIARVEAGELTQAEAYELLKAENTLYSVCLNCNTGCGIKVKILDGVAVKIDGNPYQPLPDAVRAALQADIEGLYQMFVQAVAKHRGLSEQAVRDTRAGVYRGVAAVAARLADRIGTVDAVVAELAARRNHAVAAAVGLSLQSTGISMSQASANAAAAAPAAPADVSTTTAATAAATTAAPATASQAELEQARAEGAAAERERVAAITGHANAAANPAITRQCIATGLSAEQAKGFLDAAPAAATTTANVQAGNQFAAAMAALGNPDVSGVEAAAPDSAAATAAQAAAGWGKAFGITQ